MKREEINNFDIETLREYMMLNESVKNGYYIAIHKRGTKLRYTLTINEEDDYLQRIKALWGIIKSILF